MHTGVQLSRSFTGYCYFSTRGVGCKGLARRVLFFLFSADPCDDDQCGKGCHACGAQTGAGAQVGGVVVQLHCVLTGFQRQGAECGVRLQQLCLSEHWFLPQKSP